MNYCHSLVITLGIYFPDTVEKKHLLQQTLFLGTFEHQVAPIKDLLLTQPKTLHIILTILRALNMNTLCSL